MRSLLIAALLLGPALAQDPKGFWTEAELARIDLGLELLNATRKDLGFQKRPIDDPFRLEVVDRVLDDPLALGPVTQQWEEAARSGEAARLLAQAISTVGMPGDRAAFDRMESYAVPEVEERLPPAAGPALRALLAAIDDARWMATPDGPVLRKLLLSQVEKPALVLEESDLTDAEFLARAAQAGVPLRDAAPGRLLDAVEAFAAACRGAPEWQGVVRAKSAAGMVTLYGTGDDVRTGDDSAVLVLDLGGNDTDTRGASACVRMGRPCSVLLDLAGDDRYVGGHDLSFGAALGGIAIQWDCGGDDTYVAGHASLGAGLAGFGLLVDEGGNDTYRCKDFGLGAGAFGIGLLLDRDGNDFYHCDLFGQGFASTRGCGVLADLAGQDVYDAGGVHLHAPLFNDRYQSLSQGFSIGMRPDASGGVGALIDLRGNDRYNCDIYGQGSAYWYAIGLLIDGDGNDTYNLGQYGQGSGIHLAAGMLFDRAGQDLYYDMHGVGVGGAHDYSVGFLVDRGGDDHYCGSGGSQGGALTNSVAMLLDEAGNDGYMAVKIGGAQGSATEARNTGGLALLLDGGGKDLYGEVTRDGGIWTKDLFGAGIDAPEPPETSATDPQAPRLTPEEAKLQLAKDATDLDALWKTSCLWEVGDNRVLVPAAREALWALGTPALDRAFERLGTKDGLEYRAVETTLQHFPRGQVVPRLLETSRHEEARVRKGALRAIASLAPPEAYDRLAAMLPSDAENRPSVLAALAALRRAPPEVAGLLRSPKESEGVQAAVCLGAAGDAATLATALGPDVAFPVRTAAALRLGAIGEAAVPALAGLAADGGAPPMARRNALRALGWTKSPAAHPALAAALRSEDRMVRLSARQAARDCGMAVETVETDPLLARLR